MTHKLAVIIVNYNVAFFLEQCLHSVLKACQHVDAEIWVVDNDSKDSSVEMVQKKFPNINLIANKENLGFSKANNQAIRQSNSEYVLLLNPDTLVEEDTFSKIVTFMDDHPKAGGLGVKMIDGKGVFLPESKRGLPTPTVAFYKIFGLSKFFPKSKRFGQYHLGYLDEDETNKVDILSGAFMMMRQSALDKVGLLDEAFFMYGEDIDLSYRITQGGFDNYYFADTSIIHYKGESTKKSSVNYIFVFYNAMVIFAEKHFSNKNAKLFSMLINIAIWFRASISLLRRFISWLILPLLDFGYILGALFGTKIWYESYATIDYSGTKYALAFVAYSFIWVTAMYLRGGYDKPIKIGKNISGLAYGTGLILILYSLLPESLRFSRAIILIGTILSIIIILITRYLYSLILSDYKIQGLHQDAYLIIGKKDELSRVNSMLSGVNIPTNQRKEILIEADESNKKNVLNTLSDFVDFNNIDEVIFCAKDISAQEIIQQMSTIANSKVNFKIAPPESLFIIGSNSSNKSGDFLSFNINAISKPSNVRNKRLLDFGLSALGLLASPLLIWFINNKGKYFSNLFMVLIGKKTLIGYYPEGSNNSTLPKIKPGILPTDYSSNRGQLSKAIMDRSNMLYAKDYAVQNDLQIIMKNWRHMGL